LGLTQSHQNHKNKKPKHKTATPKGGENTETWVLWFVFLLVEQCRFWVNIYPLVNKQKAIEAMAQSKSWMFSAIKFADLSIVFCKFTRPGSFIELDDGKILTGNPIFDGKNNGEQWFPVKIFP
jgi:hypothetical protein